MSTRGLYGFVVNGETKATYNHFDSYPSGLGAEIKDFIVNNSIEKIREVAERIRLVNHRSKPTDDDILKYKKHSFSNYDSPENYLELLDDIKCNLQRYVNNPEFDIMIDNKDFILDSLFCEWAYLINLDSGMLEIYKGFQKSPPRNNRYGDKRSDLYSDEDYYPCEMIKEIPFKKLNDFDMDKLRELN